MRQVQISVYSHRPEVHDGITKVRGSLDRTLAAIRFLTARGLQVLIANVLMRQNAADYHGVRALAARARRGVHDRSDDHAENGRRYVDRSAFGMPAAQLLHAVQGLVAGRQTISARRRQPG